MNKFLVAILTASAAAAVGYVAAQALKDKSSGSDYDDDDYDDDYFNFDDYAEPEDDHIKKAAPAEHEKEAAAPAAEQDEAEKEPEPAVKEAEAQEEQPEENDTLDEIQRAGEKFEETINDYKKKKGRFRFFD